MLRTNLTYPVSPARSDKRTTARAVDVTGGAARGAVRGAVRGAAKSGTLGANAAVYAGTALLMVAGLVHLWMMPGHFGDWWAYGTFYLGAALMQGLFAVALLRWPAQRLAFLGVWINLGIVLVYMLSRTSGIPFGPHAGVAEAAGALDMVATASEVGVIVLLVSLLSGGYRKFTVNALLVLGLALWALRLSGIVS